MALRFNLAVGRWLMGRHFGNKHLVGIALNSEFFSINQNFWKDLLIAIVSLFLESQHQ